MEDGTGSVNSKSSVKKPDLSRPLVKRRRIKDPFVGLTPREKGEMGSNWNAFKKDLTGNGHLIFYTFYKRHPEYLELFGAFAKSNLEYLKNDPKLQAHANAVMYFFSAIIDNMNDPNCLTMMLHKTGRNHKRDNVPIESFQNFKAVLLDVMKKQLGPKLTPLAANAWSKTLDIVISIIIAGMNTSSSGTLLPVNETGEETSLTADADSL